MNEEQLFWTAADEQLDFNANEVVYDFFERLPDELDLTDPKDPYNV